MAPMTQTKILRLLQEQSFERIGGVETVKTNVRLIAATNADLESLVSSGRFRKDLFFRLNVFTIRIPPLCDRGEDIPLLVDYYVRRSARELNRSTPSVAPEAMELLARYKWPGNVRELQSTMKQAILQTTEGGIVLVDHLPANLQNPKTESDNLTNGSSMLWDRFVNERIAANTENLYREGQELMEREVIMRVLLHTEGNQVQAARILGITRGSLRTKIRTLNISIGKSIWSEDVQDD